MFILGVKDLAKLIMEAFGRHMNNQAIAGSIALMGASMLSTTVKTVFNFIKKRITESIFSVYLIPKNTPQYLYFMAWLKEQPHIETGVMQVTTGSRVSRVIPQQPMWRGNNPRNPLNEEAHAMDFTLVPALDTLLSMSFQGSYIWINTGITKSKNIGGSSPPFGSFGGHSNDNRNDEGRDPASITTLGSKPDLVLDILRQGKLLLSKNAHVITSVFIPRVQQGYCWESVAERPARKISSVILPGNTAAQILKDCREFVAAENWYADRGIPYRRGYLLHGKPGCGKTSLVTALAGELKLPIYMLSLATQGLTDNGLLDLLNQAPPNMILLLEDIDAVFDIEKSTAEQASQTAGDQGRAKGKRGGFGSNFYHREMTDTYALSFAGILNAIDGVAAQTGRLLFMTTNRKDKLDSALIRPGRIDYEVQFAEATKGQIKDIFLNFYRKKQESDWMEKIENKVWNNSCHDISEEKLEILSEQFTAQVPENEFTTAQLQAIFMNHRNNPETMLDRLQEDLLALKGDETPIPCLLRSLSRNSGI